MTRYATAWLAAVSLLAAMPALADPAQPAQPAQEDRPMDAPANPVLDHAMTTLAGDPIDLGDRYRGKVLLIVNTASKCGYTPQYAGLQELHERYAKQGLAVLGFPCNQFGGQAPGDSEHIARFCTQNYGVAFDMFAKIEVNGDDAAPLYQYLTSDQAPIEDKGPIKWNFEKFLIGRDGRVVARFRSKVEPTSEKVVKAVEEELKAEAEDDQRADTDGPSAEDLYRQVVGFFKKAESYAFDATVTFTMELSGKKQSHTRHGQMAVKRPNMVYFRLDPVRAGELPSTVVSDGQQLMVSASPFDRYTLAPAPPTVEAVFRPETGAAIAMNEMVQLLFLTGETYADDLEVLPARSKALGMEELDGDRVRHVRLAFKIGEEQDGPTRMLMDLWIQAEGPPLVRQVAQDMNAMFEQARSEAEAGETFTKMSIVIRLDNWRVNEAIPEGTFVIHPPEGARKVASIVGGSRQEPEQDDLVE